MLFEIVQALMSELSAYDDIQHSQFSSTVIPLSFNVMHCVVDKSWLVDCIERTYAGLYCHISIV